MLRQTTFLRSAPASIGEKDDGDDDSEVYAAFKEANVSDATARQPAEAVAAYESRFASLEVKIERLDGRMTLMQWMLALLIGGVASLVIKAFA